MDIKKDLSLNPQQEMFCQEFIIDLNATKAAERSKYSKKTAAEQGCRLLRNVKIQTRIKELMGKREKRTLITQDRVLKELACLGFSNIKDYINKGSSTEGFLVFKNMDKISRKKARAIESIKVNVKEGKIEFRLHSKTKTLDMIGRHLGMFAEAGDKLAEVLYEISERFMPKTGKREPAITDNEKNK